MTIFLSILCLVIGFVLGRIYGWMKYHYPEFQEKVKLEAAKYRLERQKAETETEMLRGQIDDDLDARIAERRRQVRNVRRYETKTTKPW